MENESKRINRGASWAISLRSKSLCPGSPISFARAWQTIEIKPSLPHSTPWLPHESPIALFSPSLCGWSKQKAMGFWRQLLSTQNSPFIHLSGLLAFRKCLIWRERWGASGRHLELGQWHHLLNDFWRTLVGRYHLFLLFRSYALRSSRDQCTYPQGFVFSGTNFGRRMIMFLLYWTWRTYQLFSKTKQGKLRIWPNRRKRWCLYRWVGR